MCDEHIENEVNTNVSFVKIAERAETLAIQDFDTSNRSYFDELKTAHILNDPH